MAAAPPAVALLGAASRGAVREHWSPRGAVPRVHVSALTEASFLRDFVATSRPVVLLGATAHWRAHARWRAAGDWRERLVELAGEAAETDVNTTPTGRGDAAVDGAFVAPCTKRLPLRAALAELAGGGRCGVPYLSGQDDNVRKQLPGLLADLGGDAGCDVASAALGGASGIDAVNLWVGESRSITSATHKDHYENLVSVIVGVKRFTLLPPADVLWLYERELPPAAFAHDDALCRGCGGGGGGGGGEPCWRIARDADPEARVPWICVDPDAPDDARFPLFANASPVTVDVAAGETLYLPALWYHQVSHPQDGPTVAVNVWRDMNFNSAAFASFSLLREAALLTTRETAHRGAP